MIESLARVTYSSGQRLPEISKHGRDKTCATIGDSSAWVEYIDSINNRIEAQSTPLTEGNLAKVEMRELESATCEISEFFNLDGTEKVLVPMMEQRDKRIPSSGSGIRKGHRAREWSFVKNDFHDENRRSRKLSTRRRMKGNPSMHLSRSSNSVFNQNGPIYQRSWQERTLGKVKLV